MLRQQRASCASLQGYMLMPELMTYAQGRHLAICVTTLLAQGTCRCTLVPELAFSMTVRSIGAFATDVNSGRMTTGNQAHCVSLQIPVGLHCFMLRQ